MRICRLHFIHNEPLFRYSGLNAIPVSPVESIRMLLSDNADFAFVPIVYASLYSDRIQVIPTHAIYSDGEVLSVRIFRGFGRNYASVTDSVVSVKIAELLLGVKFEKIEDPWIGLRRYRGVLVIGDDALKMVDLGVPHMADIGKLWRYTVGKPLVYAVLACRRGVSRDKIRKVVEEIDRSLEAFYRDPDPLIDELSKIHAISRDILEKYLLKCVRYRIDERALDGLYTCIEMLGLDEIDVLTV